MSKFDEREKGFEAKFVLDQELKFKIAARRNKLLGLWAAGLMGIGGDQALAYAGEVIKSHFDEVGDEDVFRKVKADLEAREVDISDHHLRRIMEEKLAEARRHVMAEMGAKD